MIRRRCLLAGLLLLLPVLAHAQSQAAYEALLRSADVKKENTERAEDLLEQTRETVALPGPVDPVRYIVGPGDAFELLFSGALSESHSLIVGPEGTVSIPGWGVLEFSGQTIEECRDRVRQLLADRLKGVRWNLRLVAVRTMRVYAVGEVRQPGAMDVLATSRVSDVLPPSATTEHATRRNIAIHRRDGSVLTADLELFDRTGRADLNPQVLDGDVLVVPPATNFITIHGSVAHPGQYNLGPRDSLSTLIDLAGGPLPATLTEGCLLLRWRSPTQAESVYFNLEDVYRGDFNPPLEEGDRVYAYFTPSYHELFQATVLGEVRRPGTYPIVQGQTRLSDLVEAAGGFRERADLRTIRLFRSSPATKGDDVELNRLSRLSRSEMTNAEYEVFRTRLTSRREEYLVDWYRLNRVPEADVILADGDLVRVDPLLATVRVEGEVRRPGLIQFDQHQSIEDYVKLAGGLTKRADSRRLLIMRSLTGQTIPAKDVADVSPGDMIWVPVRPDRTLWEHVQSLVTTTAQVATVILAIQALR